MVGNPLAVARDAFFKSSGVCDPQTAWRVAVVGAAPLQLDARHPSTRFSGVE